WALEIIHHFSIAPCHGMMGLVDDHQGKPIVAEAFESVRPADRLDRTDHDPPRSACQACLLYLHQLSRRSLDRLLRFPNKLVSMRYHKDGTIKVTDEGGEADGLTESSGHDDQL